MPPQKLNFTFRRISGVFLFDFFSMDCDNRFDDQMVEIVIVMMDSIILFWVKGTLES